MNVLMAVTKKRRNLRRLAVAFATETDRAARTRSLHHLAKTRVQQARILENIKRIFEADCKAAQS